MFKVGDTVTSIHNPWFEYSVDEIQGDEATLTITGVKAVQDEPWPSDNFPQSLLFGSTWQNIELEQLRLVGVAA